jgi:hypothetical protein
MPKRRKPPTGAGSAGAIRPSGLARLDPSRTEGWRYYRMVVWSDLFGRALGNGAHRHRGQRRLDPHPNCGARHAAPARPATDIAKARRRRACRHKPDGRLPAGFATSARKSRDKLRSPPLAPQIDMQLHSAGGLRNISPPASATLS